MDVDEGADADGEPDPEAFGTGTPTKKGKARGLFDIPAFSATTTPRSENTPVAAATAGSGQGLGHYHGENGSGFKPGSSLGISQGNPGGSSSTGSPVKPKRNQARARRAAVQYGMVKYEDDPDEESAGGRIDDIESSASDFVPDGAGLEDEDFA